jgi:hypothetical protein
MRHRLYAVILLTTLIGASVSEAQSRLSAGEVSGFEGTWALDPEPSKPGPAESRVITVGTDGLAVAIHRREDVPPVMLTYKFDGSESVSPFGQSTATSRLRLEGGRLLTVTVFIVSDAPVTVHEFLRLNAERTELTVETMVRVEHGYQGVRPSVESKAPNVGTAVRVFRRK